MINIGDRVAYENVPVDVMVECGTVVEPTEQDDGGPENVRSVGDVLVAWDDGERFWEDPGDLVVVRGVGS